METSEPPSLCCGQGIELDKFHTPNTVRFGPMDAPVNTLGLRRIMFAADDINAVVARSRPMAQNSLARCSTRNPTGSPIFVGLRASSCCCVAQFDHGAKMDLHGPGVTEDRLTGEDLCGPALWRQSPPVAGGPTSENGHSESFTGQASMADEELTSAPHGTLVMKFTACPGAEKALDRQSVIRLLGK